ncbi:hypothetical protein DXG01_004262 [Tephrocybe rancida]|nr:hypothetical protein DXG01_004262 [Tephrocybe rancida]
MSEKQQRLVYSIIEFLNQSLEDGTVKADDKESLEVAIQCIGEAFNVDPSDEQQSKKLSVKPANLQNIFDVFLKARIESAAKPKPPTPEEKAQAENFKQTGNSFMTANKYDDAIRFYNQAIALDATNPIYFSNRAAAYSAKGDHLTAVGDSEKGIAADPKYMKAYQRLGHAYFCMGEFRKAAESFQRGLDITPDTDYLISSLQNVKQRLVGGDEFSDDFRLPSNPRAAAPSPRGSEGGMGGMADLLRGMGGMGGGMGGGGRGTGGNRKINLDDILTGGSPEEEEVDDLLRAVAGGADIDELMRSRGMGIGGAGTRSSTTGGGGTGGSARSGGGGGGTGGVARSNNGGSGAATTGGARSGAGGAGGGIPPDIASLMNDPQMMTMAQQMAQNGGLSGLMQNPAIANMVCI